MSSQKPPQAQSRLHVSHPRGAGVYTGCFCDESKAMSVQPLHGITLESLLTQLVAHYGWDGLGRKIDINCFIKDPSIKSSLKFLRKTPWARERVEALYLETQFKQKEQP